MLFVNNHKSQPVKFHLVLEQCVCPDGKQGAAGSNIGKRGFPFLLFLIAAEPRDPQPAWPQQGGKPCREFLIMLLRKNLGRRHQGRLKIIFNRLQHSQRGNDRFAASHVTLQQALHGVRLRQIAADFGESLLLGLGEIERQQLQQRPGQIVFCH